MVRHSEELLSRMIPKRIVCFLKPTPCALAWYGTRLLDHAPLCPPSQKKSKFEEFNFSFFIFLLFLFFPFKNEQVCEHCAYRNANDYNWQNKTIILAADYASNGIYNFIIPLRAHFHTKTSLNPIIILLERRPDIAFLDAISYFPLVYWMLGSIDW